MSARSHHPVGKLVLEDPRQAALKLSAVLARHDGSIGPSSRELGVNGATLRRWISRLRDEGLEVGPVRSVGVPSRSSLGHRVRCAPAEAAREIRKAVRPSASLKEAARRLGTQGPTLRKWLGILADSGHRVSLPFDLPGS